MFLRGCVSLAVLVALVLPARAHDPGLSNLHLKLHVDRLEATLTFARTDIEPLVAVDRNGNGRIDADELAASKPALEKLGARAIDIFFDERNVAPTEERINVDDNNNFEIHLIYPGKTPARLKIRSNLIRELALGHRQYVRLEDAHGESLGEVLFSAKDNLAEIDLTTASAVDGTAKPPARSYSFLDFFKLGLEHILTGYDHLLFLFGLLLVCDRFLAVAKIVTCFTLAHSLTLALAALNVVNLSSRIVEPAIAASIVYVGVENILKGNDPQGRWLLTLCFGLVHGFGFAGALREFGFGGPNGRVAMPLLSFNLGVELGQIAVAVILLPFLWRLRKNPHYLSRWMPALSSVVALLGGYWFVLRVR